MRNVFYMSLAFLLFFSACGSGTKKGIPDYKKQELLTSVQVTGFIDVLPVYLKRTTLIKQLLGLKIIRNSEQEKTFYRALSNDKELQTAVKKAGFNNLTDYLTVSYNVFEAFAMIEKMGPRFEQVMKATKMSLKRQQTELDEWKKSSDGSENKETIKDRQSKIDGENLLYKNIITVKPYEGDILKAKSKSPVD